MIRAVAAAMSRLTVWASSIRPVSSDERKPRHQSSVGGASAAVRRAALYPAGISSAGLGRSLVRMQPADVSTAANTGRSVVERLIQVAALWESVAAFAGKSRTPAPRGAAKATTGSHVRSQHRRTNLFQYKKRRGHR